MHGLQILYLVLEVEIVANHLIDVLSRQFFIHGEDLSIQLLVSGNNEVINTIFDFSLAGGSTLVARSALVPSIDWFLVLIQALNDIEQLHVEPVDQLSILVLTKFTHQKILELGHTGENAISQSIHEHNLIVLNHDDSLLECIEQLSVGVSFDIG